MSRRVVVTGLGHISPVGNTVEAGWANIVAGRSGIAPITKFDASAMSTRFAGEVKGFNAEDHQISAKDAKNMDTFIHYALAAGAQAMDDSGLKITDENAERVGVIVGSGIGGLPRIENTQADYLERGPRRISPFFVPASIINMCSGHLSIRYGLKGPNLSIVTACTTGTHSIGEAMRIIQYGEADAMLAGGAEATISPLGIGGFAAARALSQRNDDPAAASRPWDKDRDGFVLGEGAGVLMLEEYESAKRRGARIYCELVGYGRSADAFHMTAPPPDGDGARRCMTLAIANAQLNATDVDYVNAHGTSTDQGDIAETLAIKAAFGEHAKAVVVSSTKSMTGHLLGAAGGIEAIYSVLSLRDQVVPPTINLTNQDPECDLDYCANEARKRPLNVALSNSFGFGGTNGTLVFKRI
ncbi:MAG: beta-ketoacyl-ACP synthase II [Janthinobacterium lividum]